MAKILAVDDSIFQRDNICSILELAGHQVLEASNGRQALEIIATEKPDCILLDIIMPEMDGWDVLAVLHDRGVHIPIVMLTADIQESTRDKCLELGARAVVYKPVKGDELRQVLERVLEAGSQIFS